MLLATTSIFEKLSCFTEYLSNQKHPCIRLERTKEYTPISNVPNSSTEEYWGRQDAAQAIALFGKDWVLEEELLRETGAGTSLHNLLFSMSKIWTG
ncbi:unnamed protein product [Dovyalis caffra]|uniref:Uncharacterized protein n=1 Tax=Dovyalis caffra TaxID=77055 RepID=A0AAV1RPV2_9ROSI|nr:unnamed protein product [Dovyalis caffra]